MIPILYSFRRCPYAIRARLALHVSGVSYELREIQLRDKPAAILAASPKGSVPVLVLPDGQVIDESRDIMEWALNQHDPDNWLGDAGQHVKAAAALVDINDGSFKAALDRYKYADRHPEHPRSHYRIEGEQFLRQLEDRLHAHAYLLGSQITLADAAIVPFIRQFAGVDPCWFDQSPYPKLRCWCESLVNSSLFSVAMLKHPIWQCGDKPAVIESGSHGMGS